MDQLTENPAGEMQQPRWYQNQRLHDVGYLLTIFSFILYFLVLSYEGFFTRYIADDFCYAHPVLQQGLVHGSLYLYNSWSGRYSAILLTQLGSIPGYWFSSIVPCFLILGLIIVLLIFYKQILQTIGKSNSKRSAILITIATLFLFLLTTPNRYQILDWMNGPSTYTVPLIGLLSMVT